MKSSQLKHVGSICPAFLICICINSFAQTNPTITGTVVDSTTRKPLPYASVSLLKADSFYIGTAANEQGKFELLPSPGKYVMEISVMGFKKKSMPLQVDKTSNKNLTIELTSETGALKEVTTTQSAITGETIFSADTLLLQLSRQPFADVLPGLSAIS